MKTDLINKIIKGVNKASMCSPQRKCAFIH